MLNKKKFKNLMSELVKIKNDEKELNMAFRKFEPDWNYIAFGRYENIVVDLLENVMNDKGRWISYWLYELNCGKDAKKNSVEIIKKNIPVKTIDNLYDLIVKYNALK